MLITVGWALLHLSSHSRIQAKGTTPIWDSLFLKLKEKAVKLMQHAFKAFAQN